MQEDSCRVDERPSDFLRDCFFILPPLHRDALCVLLCVPRSEPQVRDGSKRRRGELCVRTTRQAFRDLVNEEMRLVAKL